MPRIYRYLNLATYQRDELESVFDRIRNGYALQTTHDQKTAVGTGPEATDSDSVDPEETITDSQIQRYLLSRIYELEEESDEVIEEGPVTQTLREQYVQHESQRFLRAFADYATRAPGNGTLLTTTTINKPEFCDLLTTKASQVDLQRTWPITVSMLLVGSSVGVITPAMPFVVEQLSLTASQYGMVVSAFGLAKMLGNIPSAIAVERHGRKPFMTWSLLIIACGVGGIGLANSFEELYICRLLTGLGVSFLSTAGTLMISDLSTPLNRASTYAPIMSAFSAGTALGPALGGILVDQVGLHPTFYMVGVSYLGVAALNRAILNETKTHAVHFPWQQRRSGDDVAGDSLSSSVQDAVGQWVPLLQNSSVRNIMIMNGMYWIALAGSQMTLLPLMLTNSGGLAMSATQVGQVYMSMSLVQIVGNPLFAKVMDKTGKAPAIVTGCTLISTAMVGLAYCDDYTQLAAALGLWSIGSSMLSTAPLAHLSDKVDDAKRAQAIALLRTCGDVGFLIGATGIGALADWTGSLETAMQSSAGLLFTATAWYATRQVLDSRIGAPARKSTS